MFKRRNGPPSKEQMHIGQPHLLHTTYDQNLMPKWSGLVASSAPSERFDDSLDSGAVFRSDHERQASSSSFADEASGDMTPRSSTPQLPHPLRSHLRAQSELPSIPSSEVSTATVSSKGHPKTRKTSLSSHIPLFANQSGKGQRKSENWEQRLNSDMNDQYTVSVSVANNGSSDKLAKPKKSSWTRMRKDGFDSRPPWKGASGRSALVEPVSDTSVPRSAARYTAVRDLPRGRMNESESDNSLGMASTTSGDGRDMSPVSMMGGRYEEDVDPVLRNDSTLDYAEKDVSPLASPSSPTPSTEGMPSMALPRRISRKPVGARKPPSGEHGALILEEREEDDTHAGAATAKSVNKDKTLPPMLPIPSDNSTVSRFSWTTVNTVTTSQLDSPPPSPNVVPLPPLPLFHEKTHSDHGSINKPPTPPLIDSDAEASEKALPKAPLSSQTMTHLEALSEQENELNIRRRNIRRIIYELMQVENASPLEVDWKTSKANKKKLEERRAQLADVEREQHELGLAISRARRRADMEDGLESGLWVRRITG